MKTGTSEYINLHAWVRKIMGTPTYCAHCGDTTLKRTQYDWANVSKEYKKDVSDWIRLCKKCHRKYDNPDGLCRRKLHKLSEQDNPKINRDGYYECRICRNEKRRAHYHIKKHDTEWYERKKQLTKEASRRYRNKE